MQCPNDKHNFIEADVYTGGIKYRCDKCGLEADAPIFSGKIFKEYFGSYIDGISHKWDSGSMCAADITNFAISFGDIPIVTVRYDGNKMKIKNKINGSRDGWMSFPEGFFDEKIITLSEKDKRKLNEGLLKIDFNSFVTSQNIFRNFGADGFNISERFICHFSDGKGFECLSPQTDDFITLVSVIKEILGLKTDFFYEEDFQEKTIPGIVVSCCRKAIPDFFSYCPYCGKVIDDKTEKCDVLYDSYATLWLCDECGSGNQFKYKFCEKCGVQRPW